MERCPKCGGSKPIDRSCPKCGHEAFTIESVRPMTPQEVAEAQANTRQALSNTWGNPSCEANRLYKQAQRRSGIRFGLRIVGGIIVLFAVLYLLIEYAR